nr:DUF2793 domain-containing protein [Rhodobacter sp. SGA-6-6]
MDWSGRAGQVAVMTAAGWQFHQPRPGWQAQVLAEGQVAVFDGLTWKTPSEGPLTARLGVSATPDAVNRLAVSAPATLLNHAGAGHQLKLNKAAAGDTASLLFQTGFSGRAEMGATGGDEFQIRTSADGAGLQSGCIAIPNRRTGQSGRCSRKSANTSCPVPAPAMTSTAFRVPVPLTGRASFLHGSAGRLPHITKRRSHPLRLSLLSFIFSPISFLLSPVSDLQPRIFPDALLRSLSDRRNPFSYLWHCL